MRPSHFLPFLLIVCAACDGLDETALKLSSTSPAEDATIRLTFNDDLDDSIESEDITALLTLESSPNCSR